MNRLMLFRVVLLLAAVQFVLLLSDARIPVHEQFELFDRVEAKAMEWHESCMNRLHDLKLSPESEALAAGVLFGDRSLLPKESIREVRQAGMSHILAVSGLHVGIVWMLIMFVLSLPMPFVIRMGWNELLFYFSIRLLTLLLLWVYVFVVGCPPSAVRAGLMISVTQVSLLLNRDPWAWNNLLIAMFIMLLIQPELLYDVGFQLSVAATSGILAFRPLLVVHGHRRMPLWGRVLRWLRGLLVISFSAQVFTFPLVAYYFHQVPLLGWVQGLLVIPVLSVMIYLLVFVLVFPLTMLLHVAELLASWIMLVARHIGMAELWLVGGRVEWYPTVLETAGMELILVAAVVCWRIGYRHNTHADTYN